MEDSAILGQKMPRHRLNWWKIGFFFMLFVFECCREIIVSWSDVKAVPDVPYKFFHDGTNTEATGFWRRTDKKEAMDGIAVSIQCDEKRGTCILVYLHIKGLKVFPPDLLDLPAHFKKDSIDFIDHKEGCFEGPIEIDLTKKVVRHWHEPKCKTDGGRRERVSYVLSNDLDPDYPNAQTENQHFLPLLATLNIIYK